MANIKFPNPPDFDSDEERRLRSLCETALKTGDEARETIAWAIAALRGSCIFPPEEPAVVYHYTSIEGLSGIIQSRGFRATDLSYMNDTTEFNYGTGFIEETIAGLRHPLVDRKRQRKPSVGLMNLVVK